ncbi:glycosyltransferase family protein [Oecophyllibacter saccharovorans]|uniref:Glycosyltransferase n=1 Tax=Oecophyllibacter saccharovorans TaxID=2558360 RepID=A0A506ULG8_9PROT|nr:glycosyltransferase [Oecophyllibacter saccharovorans]TPW34179.1 glycosyltransferase [Oecophyllibacter saccharovorans]
MAVIYNTNYTHNPNAYLTLAIVRAAEEVFGQGNVVLADNMTLASLAASGEHDTLICIDGQRMNVPLMRRVRPAFKSMILWTFEDPFMKDFNVENAGLFDQVFTNDPSCVEAYFGKGHYLPLASSRSLHERPVRPSEDCDYDIFFAGTMWPNRVQTLRRVINAFPKARLKLICPGNPYLPPLPDDLAALAIQRPVSHEAFIDFANASRVTLTMFRDYASHGTVSQATAPGPRYFELALAGTAQVVEVAPGMDRHYFDSLQGVSMAENAEEVVQAIGALLEDPARRDRAAVEAQRSAAQHHLYVQRLEEMRDVSGADFSRRPASAVVPVERRRRLRVLMCTHSTIHEEVWGGVEVYQQMLCSMLGREVEFYYWLRRGNFCRLMSANGQELERFDIHEGAWTDIMCDGAEETLFSNVISQYNIDVVHFQHLGHHALSLPVIAKANGVGVLFSAHDFWLVSSRYNLLNQNQRYVEGEFETVQALDIILKTAEGVEFGGAQTRRAFIERMLHHVDAIMFGTAHSHDMMHEIFPVLDSKISLVNGIPTPESTLPITPKAYAPLEGRPLGVAVTGNFLRTKGADAILALIEAANPRHFHFHIFGHVHPEYQGVLEGLERPNVTVYGRYEPGNVEALQKADVALTLSIWPETYCISLSETWRAGLVPIVTDVGALGDRVEDGVNGFKVPIGRPEIVLNKLELLRSSESLRRRMMAAIDGSLWTHEAQYGAELLDLYRQLAPKRELGVADLQFDVGQLNILPHASWRHQAPPRHIFDEPISRELSLTLPADITDWFAIQGGECYVDDICHQMLNEDSLEVFESAPDFHIRGWFFLPDVSSAGQLYVVLINEDTEGPLIFMQTTRELRADISTLFPGAPRRSGYVAQVALRGKWCEGRYRIGLVNVINGRGAFQLLAQKIEVEGGKVVDIAVSPPSNGQILSDFQRLLKSDTQLREVLLPHFSTERLYPAPREHLLYFLDTLELADNEEGALFVQGWAFSEGNTRAGQVYVVLISETEDEIAILQPERFARDDVQSVWADAPLCAGFIGVLHPWQGQVRRLNGNWRLGLVNVVGDTYTMRPLEKVLTLRDGHVQEIPRDEPLTPEAEARARRLIAAVAERRDIRDVPA